MSQDMLIGQILRALSNHSELITQAYTQGRVQTESSTNIQLLVNSGLLQGNTSDGFRLVAPLRDMLDIVIQREKRRIKVSASKSASVFTEIATSHLKTITSTSVFRYDLSRTC